MTACFATVEMTSCFAGRNDGLLCNARNDSKDGRKLNSFLLPALFATLLFIFSTSLSAQIRRLPYNWEPVKNEFIKGDNSFFLQDTSVNKKRSIAVTATTLGGYGLAYAGMAYTWYRDYPLTKFHWFNDNHEWAQIDKMGHFMGGYQGGRGMIALFKWSGLPRKKAALYGGLIGGLAMVPVELLDGFAEKWGASWGDIIADMSGGALAFGNEMLWAEQRIQAKVSWHPTAYANVRPDLFGDKYTKFMKDYNGHTGWLSVRVHSFLPEGKFKDFYPRWLNLAVGYGANGLLGGYDNGLTPAIRDREYRQWYISPDIDLNAIKTKSGGLKFALSILSLIHLPSPTLEYNSKHGVRWHWLYM
ncbi:MAG: DUF2279 domain-containing protein [Bacteroidia bacterium]